MLSNAPGDFARRLYRHHLDAEIKPSYMTWRSINAPDGHPLAVLGYRSADTGSLYLEAYLNRPIEKVIHDTLAVEVSRSDIVEIGCLAAMPSAALVRLWLGSAIELGARHKIAVATLTAPLRKSFERVGLPLHPIVRADPLSAPRTDEQWGDYYGHDPIVCAGFIGEGAAALSRYANRLGQY
jgi:hypothetical protein